MNAETSAGLVRRWVAFYTRGLSADVRRDRLDEIADDLWCQLSDSSPAGRTDGSVAGEILGRLVLGIPADVSWRLAQRRPAPARIALARSSMMNARVVAVLAILGGVGWAVWPIPQAIYGDAGWSSGSVGMLLFVSVIGGTWALAGAILGLVFGFADRIRGLASILGSLGALLGAVSVFGAFGAIVALPLGSAVVMWELGRIGALGSRLIKAHIAAAILWLLPIAALLVDRQAWADSAVAVTLSLLLLPYAASWILVGWTLVHEASSQPGPAAGA